MRTLVHSIQDIQIFVSQEMQKDDADSWPTNLAVRPINNGDSWVDIEGDPYQAWLIKRDDGDWEMDLLSAEDVALTINPLIEDILSRSDIEPVASDTLAWDGNLTGRDNRQPPVGLESFWLLQGDSGVIAIDNQHFHLVRIHRDGVPETIERQGTSLFPPESFDLRSGALTGNYRLKLDVDHPLPPAKQLPEGAIDAEGYIDVSIMESRVAWMYPNPDNPEEKLRFHPFEESFVVGRLPVIKPATFFEKNAADVLQAAVSFDENTPMRDTVAPPQNEAPYSSEPEITTPEAVQRPGAGIGGFKF